MKNIVDFVHNLPALHAILIVMNFTNPRFDSNVQTFYNIMSLMLPDPAIWTNVGLVFTSTRASTDQKLIDQRKTQFAAAISRKLQDMKG